MFKIFKNLKSTSTPSFPSVIFRFISYSDPKNPKVFFDISKTGGKKLGRLVFQLYSNHNPKTAQNFRQLCIGHKELTYKDSKFHRIIPRFMAQGGDITHGNGMGGMSIYGRTFPDQNMTLKHHKPGLLSMANAGKNTNGSQFFITFVQTPWLDKMHCVFGEVVQDDDNLLKLLQSSGTDSGTPASQFQIMDCGEIVKNQEKTE